MPNREHNNFVVVSEEFRFPYSRGLMARSLIRASLPMEESYKIASILQENLLAQGVKEIPRRKLKQLAMKLIQERLGKEAAEKYKNWKTNGGTILVGEKGQQQPFSRGILAQSLLAAGLDPEIAHRVTEKMAVDLSEWGIKTITRDELRRLTYQKILSDFGKPYARHYLLWRTLKRPDKPLILLFGGATGTGKSTLSVEIAHRLGITRVIGTDTIREIMRGMFSRKLMPSIYESSYSVWRTMARPLGDSQDTVLAAFQEQTQRIDVGVKAIIHRAINENLSTIIEGVHLIPEKEDPGIQNKAIILQVLISTLDEENHRNRFIYRGQDAVSRSSQRYLENFESIRKIQDALTARAKEYDVFIVDNVYFDETVSKIIQFLTRRMGELIDIDFSAYESTKEAGN